jgi:hypothetical protein
MKVFEIIQILARGKWSKTNIFKNTTNSKKAILNNLSLTEEKRGFRCKFAP